MRDASLFTNTVWGDPVDGPFDPTTVKPGRFDARVLDQDRLWVCARGRTHLLRELDPCWRRNIGAFLYAKARLLHLVCGLCEAFGVTQSAAEYWAMIGCGAPTIADADPYDWLESTVFFRALRRVQPDLAAPAALREQAEARHAAFGRDQRDAVGPPQAPPRGGPG